MATIKIDSGIQTEIAQRVVEQAHPGYSKEAQGQWYVVNGSKVVHADANRSWNPWSDGDEVVGVEDLVFFCGGAEGDNADFDPSPTGGVSDQDAYEAALIFASNYVPDAYDTADLPYEDA